MYCQFDDSVNNVVFKLLDFLLLQGLFLSEVDNILICDKLNKNYIYQNRNLVFLCVF